MRKYDLSVALMVLGLTALAPTSTRAQKQVAATGEVTLTAVSANVTESGQPVRIRILRWSTDEERSPVIAALTPPAASTAPAGTVAGSPTNAGANPSAGAGDRGGAARGGRAAGRGGRGGARGGRGDAGGASNPIAALTTAIGKAPTLGYIWTNDVTGYSIKYAYHASLPDGERIILATDRRFGAYTAAWTPVASATVTDYEFTLFEIRLDPKGLGEGRTSLTTKVILDRDAGTIALENATATPALLQHVKR